MLDEPTYNRYLVTFNLVDREERKKNKGMPPKGWA